VKNASTTQEEDNQVMQEEHNALNDDIGVKHILPPQDSNYEVPTDLRVRLANQGIDLED
jgi:hypothetical protein